LIWAWVCKEHSCILEICKILSTIYKKVLSNHHAFNRFNQECEKESDAFTFCNDIESKKSFWKIENNLYQCSHFKTLQLKCRSLHEDQCIQLWSWRHA